VRIPTAVAQARPSPLLNNTSCHPGCALRRDILAHLVLVETSKTFFAPSYDGSKVD